MSVEVTDAGLVRSNARSAFDEMVVTKTSHPQRVQVVLGDTSISCGMPADRIQALNSRMDALCPVAGTEAVTPEPGKTGANSVPRRRVRCTSVTRSGSGARLLFSFVARCCLISNRQPSHRRAQVRERACGYFCMQTTRFPTIPTTVDIAALVWF